MGQQDCLQVPAAFHVLLMRWQSVQAAAGAVWEAGVGQIVQPSQHPVFSSQKTDLGNHVRRGRISSLS